MWRYLSIGTHKKRTDRGTSEPYSTVEIIKLYQKGEKST